MSENQRADAETGATPDEKQTDTRTPRAIRFSDSEWDEVKTAAAEHKIPAAEFVRDAALDLARNKNVVDPAAMPPGTVALIERIYRSTYIVATLKRDEMLREGRGDELDEMIKLARETQATILEDASK